MKIYEFDWRTYLGFGLCLVSMPVTRVLSIILVMNLEPEKNVFLYSSLASLIVVVFMLFIVLGVYFICFDAEGCRRI